MKKRLGGGGTRRRGSWPPQKKVVCTKKDVALLGRGDYIAVIDCDDSAALRKNRIEKLEVVAASGVIPCFMHAKTLGPINGSSARVVELVDSPVSEAGAR